MSDQDREAMVICNNLLLDTYKSYNGATLRRSLMKVEQDLDSLKKIYNDLYISSQELLEKERNDRRRVEQENSTLLQELQISRQRESILQKSYEAVLNTNLILHNSHQGLFQELSSLQSFSSGETGLQTEQLANMPNQQQDLGLSETSQVAEPLPNAPNFGLAISFAPQFTQTEIPAAMDFPPLLEQTPSLGSYYTTSTETTPTITDESPSPTSGSTTPQSFFHPVMPPTIAH
ncbi:hypothetical protein TWF718_001557 [Orbilia javanica]|uniref:Uncharacterized protein n=1 Tax=Orbilia javanica TaxID=47235 RepID=A0AAN8NE15_9PEZI